MTKKIDNNEFDLKKFYTIITNYKWLLITLMLISTIIMSFNLYFKPSIYLSNSIIEIKTKSKPQLPNDILLNSLAFGGNAKIEKEIELLKTFSMTEKALKKLDFSVKYFDVKNYKNIELYKSSPIKITDIAIYNPHIVGKEITLFPHKEYFTLSIKNSFKDSLLSFLSPPTLLELEKNKKYYYDKIIKTDFFKFSIKKNSQLEKPMKFILCGSNRQIYYNIIEKSLSINQQNANAPLVQISYQDTIPERANEYITALTESFIETSIENKNKQNNKMLDFINQELEKIKINLKSSENKLETYKINNQIIEPSIQASKYIEKLSEIEIKRSENILKQKLISNLLLFTRNNNNLDAIAPSLMELNDKPTLQLITTLQNLQITESNLETELTNKHPKLITVRKQMYNIRQKIIYNLKNLKGLILTRNRSLDNEKASYITKIEKLPKEEKTIVNMNRDYKVSSTMYNYLLKKKTEIELIVISTLSNYKVIDKAYTQSKPIKPKKALLMLISPLIGLFLGIIIATLLQGLNKKISSYSELKALSNIPILGVIPELNKKDIKLEVYTNLHSRFTERYRSLRNNIPIKSPSQDAKIITITSTIANEGKTTVTSNLASVFQMAGYKSILLSLDLRKPTLHEYFDLQNEKGMSSYLAERDSIQDIIFATRYTDLHIITAGPIPNNPSELILSKKLIELLEILKSKYDYIFIDTAPIGLVSDSIHLMKLSDHNIIVLRENYSEESFLESLNNIVQKHQLKNLGLVLNRSKSKSKSYGYGYGYGYGK